MSLSSGGIHFCAQLGAVAELLDAGMLSEVREWHGCSAGAMVAVCAVLGVSSSWMRVLMETLQIASITLPQFHCVESFLERWGLNDGLALMEYFGSVVDTWEPGFSTWTFADLAVRRPGVKLTLIATNVTGMRLQRFSAETTPHVRVVEAMRASSSIPLYFVPWQDASGDLYCDGAATEYYPWSYLDDKDNTLVIVCNPQTVRPVVASQPQTLAEYIRHIMFCFDRAAARSHFPRHWIGVGSPHIAPIDFKLPAEQRLALFDSGRAAARGWIAWSRHLTDSGRATAQTPARSDCPRTLSSDLPSPGLSSGSPEYRSPSPSLAASRDLRTPLLRSSRRWSL